MSISVNSGAFYRFPETCGQFGFIAYEMWGFVSSLKPEWVCVGFLFCFFKSVNVIPGAVWGFALRVWFEFIENVQGTPPTPV